MSSFVFLARHNLKRSFYVFRNGLRNFSQKVEQDNTPVKFSTSEAAGWRAEFTRTGIYDDSPGIQPFVVSISTGIFMLYFLYLREESDIDEKLNINADIYNKVEGLEEVHLRTQRQDMLNDGKSVTEIDKRLKKLELERLEKSSK